MHVWQGPGSSDVLEIYNLGLDLALCEARFYHELEYSVRFAEISEYSGNVSFVLKGFVNMCGRRVYRLCRTNAALWVPGNNGLRHSR